MFHPVDPGRLLSGFVGVDPGVTVTRTVSHARPRSQMVGDSGSRCQGFDPVSWLKSLNNGGYCVYPMSYELDHQIDLPLLAVYRFIDLFWVSLFFGGRTC